MKLKRWLVTATQSMQFEIEVKAKDQYEAQEKAEEIDGALWKKQATWCDDWDITGVEEIKEAKKVK